MVEYHCYLNNSDVQVNIKPGHTIYINPLALELECTVQHTIYVKCDYFMNQEG